MLLVQRPPTYHCVTLSESAEEEEAGSIKELEGQEELWAEQKKAKKLVSEGKGKSCNDRKVVGWVE